ncbi:thioesterase family protein [Saccharomonospora sp. NPDC006951]
MTSERVTATSVWSLDRFLTLTPHDQGWSAEVPPSWSPTGSAHGGFLFGLAVRAMRLRAPLPNLLTATAHFLRRTMPGPASVSAELLRAGRAHATVQATISQNGKDTVRVIAIFGTLRSPAPDTELTPPVLPPPAECVPLRGTGRRREGLSEYSEGLDVRIHPETSWTRGEFGGKTEVTGWCRQSDDRPHDDASLVLFADAFPPPILNLAPMASVPTLELTVHVRGIPSSSWLRGRFTTRAVNDPYVEEDGLLWDEEGRLVAMSRQLAIADLSARPAL